MLFVLALCELTGLGISSSSSAASVVCATGSGDLQKREAQGRYVEEALAEVVKGGTGVGPPRGYLGLNHRKSLETAQPTRQKAIQDLLSRCRWSPGPSIFDGFLADLNRALSAVFFQKSAILAFLEEPPNEAILGLCD